MKMRYEVGEYLPFSRELKLYLITWIPYQLAKPAEVTLTIYNIRGVVVRELKLGHQPAGLYHNRSRAIHWDGRNAFGEKVATGVYFYTLTAGDYTATRKLLIRK